MEIIEKPFFIEFYNKHFGPREEVIYRLQLKQISVEARKGGRFDKTLTTRDGEAIIVYYYYDGSFDTLYVLSGHMNRAGEPGRKELAAIERYIREIEGGR